MNSTISIPITRWRLSFQWFGFVLFFIVTGTGIECTGQLRFNQIVSNRGVDPLGMIGRIATSPILTLHVIAAFVLVLWLVYSCVCHRIARGIVSVTVVVALVTAISWWLIPSPLVHLSGVLLLVILYTTSEAAADTRMDTNADIPSNVLSTDSLAVPSEERGRFPTGILIRILTYPFHMKTYSRTLTSIEQRSYQRQIAVPISSGFGIFRTVILYLWILAAMRLRPEWIPLSAPPDTLILRLWIVAILSGLGLTILLLTTRRRWLMTSGLLVFLAIVCANYLFCYSFPDSWDFLRDRIRLTLEPWPGGIVVGGIRRILTISELWLGVALLRSSSHPE